MNEKLTKLIKERLAARGYVEKEEKIINSYRYDSKRWAAENGAYGNKPMPEENGDAIYEEKQTVMTQVDDMPEKEVLALLLIEQEKDIEYIKKTAAKTAEDISYIKSTAEFFKVIAIIGLVLAGIALFAKYILIH